MQKAFSWNEINNLPDNTIIYGFFYDIHRINPVRTKLNLEVKEFVIKKKNNQPYSNYTFNGIYKTKQNGALYKQESRYHNHRFYSTLQKAEEGLKQCTLEYKNKLLFLKDQVNTILSTL